MALSREQLRTLVLAHQAELLRYLRYLGADAATAEDIAQDAFVAALESGTTLRDDAPRVQAAWLRGTARNLFLMHCRSERRSPVRVTSRSLAEAEDVWTGELLRDGDGFDYVSTLRRCVGELTGRKREVIDRSYAKGQSRRIIADAFHMSEDGVKSLLRRVRRVLGDCVRAKLAAEDAR